MLLKAVSLNESTSDTWVVDLASGIEVEGFYIDLDRSTLAGWVRPAS
jgi:hypothetical protein